VASAGAVAVVGFCWGGSLAWRMGCDKASALLPRLAIMVVNCYRAAIS